MNAGINALLLIYTATNEVSKLRHAGVVAAVRCMAG
jgi:hypothetical protein